MHLSCPSHVPHVPPISFFLNWSPNRRTRKHNICQLCLMFPSHSLLPPVAFRRMRQGNFSLNMSENSTSWGRSKIKPK
jgi:hypothetical protein